MRALPCGWPRFRISARLVSCSLAFLGLRPRPGHPQKSTSTLTTAAYFITKFQILYRLILYSRSAELWNMRANSKWFASTCFFSQCFFSTGFLCIDRASNAKSKYSSVPPNLGPGNSHLLPLLDSRQQGFYFFEGCPCARLQPILSPRKKRRKFLVHRADFVVLYFHICSKLPLAFEYMLFIFINSVLSILFSLSLES